MSALISRRPRVHVPQCVAGTFVAALLVASHTAQAQNTNRKAFVLNPAYQTWSFDTAVPVDSLNVSAASQIAVPFLLRVPLGTMWSATASGAAFSSTVETENATETTTRTLSGITDIRVRATGRLLGDAFRLTVGVNIPTGAVGLSREENDVLRVLAAPALGAQVAVPGTGFGGTVGVVSARTFGAWAWAVGASYEKRGNYSPIEAQIAGVAARTEFEPGSAAHFTIGADGLMGVHRLTFGVVADMYGSDIVRTLANDNVTAEGTYQLGPTVLATASLHINNPHIRDLTLRVANRYRSAFKDADGAAVDGSSGNYFDAGASGMLGRPGRPSLILGVDVRQHGGLPVDENFIGAGLTEFGVTLGASFPTSTLDFRPLVRASQGTLKTGRTETTMMGITAGMSIGSR